MSKKSKIPYIVGTTNIKTLAAPIDWFGANCLKRNKKGKWTHRLDKAN